MDEDEDFKEPKQPLFQPLFGLDYSKSLGHELLDIFPDKKKSVGLIDAKAEVG